MDSWTRVIIEWINCLGLCEKPISNLQDLQDDTIFYSKLIRQLSNNSDKLKNDCYKVEKFIRDEYPDFILPKDEDFHTSEQILLASLMLVSISQNETFHKPMYSLKNDTQVLIKRFLELILPYGKNITLDSLNSIILELGDSISTPQTPKDRPLKTFLSSPAAQSAYRSNAINERNRELRMLRAQLETELFEKADLQEDIKTLEDKLQKLQKKLQNKSDELRSVKLERTLISTPQSTKKCHRAENTEEVLKKEVQHLESCNLKLQIELDKLQEEQDGLKNKLASKERLNLTLKKNSEECEKGMETLIAQLEAKTSELLDLRMQNEDLRQHILEMQKHPLELEQSFDVENLSGLNVSEAASSIIEVQLREAVGECSRLKNELTSLQEKLNLTVQDYTESKLQNEMLNEKLIHLDEIKMNLEMAEDKLEKRDCQINILGMEKQSLLTDLDKLRQSIVKKDKIIEETGEERKKLENEMMTISEELNNLKISLVTTEDTLSQTITTKEVLEMKLKSLDDKIIILDQSLTAEVTKYAELTENTDEKIRQLEEKILNDLEEKQQLDEVIEGKNKELERILQEFNEQNIVISTLHDKISQLDIELNAASSALKNSETKLCELSELREELHSQLNQEKITAAKLLEEKHNFEINLSSLEDTKNELIDKISEFEKYISKLEGKNIASKIRFEISQDYCRKSDKNNQKLSLEIEDLNSVILQLKKTNEDLENNLKNSVEKIEKLENEKKISEENYKKSDEKIQNFEYQIEQLNLAIDKKNFEITELKKREEKLQIDFDKIQYLNEELEESKKILEENSVKSVEKIQNLELDVQNKILKIQEYNSDILTLKNDYTKLAENFQKSEQINHDLEELKNKTEEKNFKLQEKLENLHSEIAELTLKIEAVNCEVCELKNIQENLQNRLTQEQESSMKLLTEKVNLERALNQAELEKLSLAEEKSIITSQLEKNQQETLNLETKYSNRNANYNEALERLEILTSEIQTLKSELDKAINDYSDLKQTHIHLNTQLHETKNTIESLTTEKSSLENLVSLRDEEKHQLEEKIDSLAQDLEKSRQEMKNLSENAKIHEEQYKKEKSSEIEEINRELTGKNAEILTLATKHEILQQTTENIEENYKMQLKETQNIQSDLVKIQELLESKEKLIADYEKQEKKSKEEILSLENQISATTMTLNDVKLSLKAKIDETTAEKALSELKLDEKIEKLKEINSNQRLEFESQARILAERELELQTAEKRYLTDKTDLEIEINRQKTENRDLKEQLDTLTQSQSEITQKIEDLELKLATETVELQKSREKYQNLKEDTLKLLEKCEKPCEETSETSNDNFHDCTIEKLFKNLSSIMGDLKTSQKIVSDLEEAKKTLENDLSKEKSLLTEALNDQTVKNQLEKELNTMKLESKKQNEHFTSLKTAKRNLKNHLTAILQARDDLDAELSSQRKIFDSLSQEIQVSLKGNTCDELKHLEATRSDLETKITALNAQQTKNLESLIKIVCQELEQDVNDISIDEKPTENPPKAVKSMLEAQITANKKVTEEISQLKTKITDLQSATEAYKQNLKSGTLKREPNSEEKLQAEVHRLSKEKKEMQEKLEATRARNTKMEKNLDELRGELRRLKDEKSSETTENDEITRLTKQTEDLESEIERLQTEKRELEKRPLEEDFEHRLREVHGEYEQKLERLKQKMKVAYSEQMEKLNADQTKALAEKVSEIRAKAERQCKKYSEDIAKYKAHISDLSSQFWDVGEKLLAEKQEKEKALELVHELQRTNNTFSEIHHSTAIAKAQAPRDLKVQVIEERTTTTRRHSVKSIQAMGNAFNVEDEEGEVFDSVCLTDLKEGRCRVVDSAPDFDRISELRMRNSLCQPHLKSSYAAETNFHPLPLTEEDIKGGPTSDDIFNDSLNQSLLPGQKAKKKDRTQTSYKRPGPPTPSKHGHRLSLQGNELKSPNARILRERNSERRTTATPKRLKAFFTSATSRRLDENVLGTPKARRLSSFFRKPQPADKN